MITIRRAFLLLVAPLFLLLGGVNGALLFSLETAEAARELDHQAIAAAVTVAAFASGADDLAATLRDPRRDADFRAAAARVEGLDGIYLADASGRTVQIAGRAHAQGPGRYAPPRKPVALPVRRDASGRRLATALAPMSGGRFVIAQIDAKNLDAEIAQLRMIVAGVLAGAGLLGLGLAWFVAGRIARELAANDAAIAAIREGRTPADTPLGIRETRDLANAVRLMKTSVTARLARGDRELALRDRQRGEAGAVNAYREAALPRRTETVAGVELAIRGLGRPPAGAFYALAQLGDRAALVLGECRAGREPEALADALAARDFLERRLLNGDPAESIAEAARAFGVGRVVWTAWSVDRPPPVRTLALLDDAQAAKAGAYADRARLSPEAVADDLDVLLDADGYVAVLGERREG